MTAYRLAVADGAVVVERDGGFAPLAELLTAADRQRLGDAPADLQPLLDDWDYWRVTLPERIVDARFVPSQGPQRFAPLVARPGKLVCIGANFHDHIAEMNAPMVPTYPYAFIKPSSSLCGSGDRVAIPRQAAMVDWEAELAVVIGRRARHVAAADALDIVAGYANLNDLSARDWIATSPPIGTDWVLHKAFDGFAPFGPYFVPAEQVPDPQALPMRLSVNDVVKQQSNTEQMVFGVRAIIAHLSSVMTLEPGDVIATGTPAGVGFGRKPPEFLKAGDRVEIEIGDLGVLRTEMVAE